MSTDTTFGTGFAVDHNGRTGDDSGFRAFCETGDCQWSGEGHFEDTYGGYDEAYDAADEEGKAHIEEAHQG